MKSNRYRMNISPVLLSVVFLVASVFVSMAAQKLSERAPVLTEPVSSARQASGLQEENAEKVQRQEIPKEEMRAVWVPYMSLDMSKGDGSYATFQKAFDGIVAGAKEKGMNTLIVHVRPFGDAFYPSEYFPWSSYLTGKQGVNPGYDPLEYMVSAAHQAGLQIHAWVNPLRIQSKETPAVLSQNNPYNAWKADPAKADWTVDFESGKYYNPAYAEVRKLVADGVKEIAEHYDVDGIQFDDYFYPTESAAFDKTAYDAYTAGLGENGTALSLADWRRANINAMVSLCYSEIKSVKPEVLFGISPQGNVSNDLKMGADVKSWCSAGGYVDYICPQLYVNFEHPVLPYDTAAKEWRELVTFQDVKLYLGLAVYKAGSDADEGTWKNSDDILARQVELGRQLGCDGFMFYSWQYLSGAQTEQEVENVMKVLTGVQ